MKNSKKIFSIIIVCLLSFVMSISVLAETSSNSVSSSISSAASSTETQTSSSVEAISSTDTDSSDVESELEESSVSGTVSLITNKTSSTATSSKSGYQGNVGGAVNDGVDTSEWGTGQEENSELQSVGTTDKTNGKDITDFESLFWILIWIPILLILGSIGALIYVNRKSFLNPEKGKNNNKKNSKNSKNKRSNVYKPRD